MTTTTKLSKKATFKMRIQPEKKSVLETPNYNSETLDAMQEAKDIMSGKIDAKSYHSASELMADIMAEVEAEDHHFLISDNNLSSEET